MSRFRLVIYAMFLLFIGISPLIFSNFQLSLLNFIGIYTLAALGLTLLTGWTGLTSFGQAAFLGIGAYASAWLTTTWGWSPWLGLLLALVVTTIVAIALGIASLPLSGHYLPLTTLAWGMAIFLLFGNIDALGRQSGINQVPNVSLFGWTLDRMGDVFLLVWAFVGLAFVITNNLRASREGIAARALRSGRIMARSVGIDPFRTSLIVFVIASMLGAISGWLYAHMQHYVGPAPFSPLMGIELLLMAVVGGLGSLAGALVGAAFITLLKNYLQDLLPLLTSHGANIEIVAFGILFIGLLHYARGGIMGFLAFSPRRDGVSQPAVMSSLPRRTQPAPGTLIFQAEGVTKRFGGLLAVNDVTFSLYAGEILGVIGPNGAGKSTLFNMLSGTMRPTSGRVHLAGGDIARYQAQYMSRLGFSRTFQHVKLRPDMTLIENVVVGCYARTRAGFVAGMLGLDQAERIASIEEAKWQLSRVGLLAKAGDRAGNLSLGEQRMLEVARALAADPMVILLDEPAAGLRHLEKQALADLLRLLRRDGCTVLLIEHDMSFVMELVDRLVVLDQGAKIAEGNPTEIRANVQVNRAYLGGIDDGAAA
jgi:branched-chain amino acid transport system permease protein